jgi:hypothetical protein
MVKAEGAPTSRGSGKWARGILAALETHPVVLLNDLLPRERTRAEHSALNRAAIALAEKGTIAIWYRGSHGGAHSIAVARPGHGRPRWKDIPRLTGAERRAAAGAG